MTRQLIALVAAWLLFVSQATSGIFWFQPALTTTGGSPTYLIDESAEGTGTPSGWVNVGSPDWDESTVVLAGSQSIELLGAGTAPRIYYDTTAVSEVWVRFMWRASNAVGGGATHRIFSFRVVSGDSEIAYLDLNADSTLQINHGTANASTVAALSSNTTYYIWMRYKAGTGSNGEASVAFSTDGVKPTSGDNFASVSTGTSTASADRFQWRNNTADATSFYNDNLLVDDENIGSI